MEQLTFFELFAQHDFPLDLGGVHVVASRSTLKGGRAGKSKTKVCPQDNDELIPQKLCVKLRHLGDGVYGRQAEVRDAATNSGRGSSHSRARKKRARGPEK